jgi:hypothetical protein
MTQPQGAEVCYPPWQNKWRAVPQARRAQKDASSKTREEQDIAPAREDRA